MRRPVVGDRFYRVETLNHREPRCGGVVVEKVGRTWATAYPEGRPNFKHLKCRFDMETGRLHHEGFSSPGRVYDDEKTYKDAVRCETMWSEFRRKLNGQYAIPDGVTELDILKAADALKMKLEKGWDQ
jgi:hypothetical protein